MDVKNKSVIFMVIIISIIAIVIGGIYALMPGQSAQKSSLRALGPQAANDTPSTPEPGNPPLTDQSNPISTEGVIIGQDVKHDVSPTLRDLALQYPPPVESTTIREMGEPGVVEEILPDSGRPQIADPVLQSDFFAGLNGPAPLIPSPQQSFEGINNIDGVYPPDPNGEVGPNHFVQMVNLHYQIYTKTGTPVLANPLPNNSLWSGFGGSCQTRNDGDPIILYDQLADRWLLSQFTATNPYGECIAISTTGDPAGSYYRYFFQFSTSVFYDYPKLGVWPDGYYLTANRFGGIFQSFQGASAIVFNRTAMLSGQSASFQQFNTSTSYGALLPADLEGRTMPPSGSPEFFAEIGSTALHIWKFHVDWITPSSSTFTGPTTLSVAAYNTLCSGTRSCIPQPGTSVRLDGIGDRVMNRLIYRNMGSYETLVVSHNVNAASSGTRAGVRWYEIRNPNGTMAINQQSTYAPADNDNRWMGSVEMDGQGNMAMVYSVASANTYPSIRYTGRLRNDPLSSMPQGEGILMAGTGSQTGTASRWGDYANISIDPLDDCTFWFTTEYIQTTGTAPWRTRIGSFKFPGCGSPPPPSPTPTNTNPPPPPSSTPTPTNTGIPPTSTFTPTPTNTGLPPTATSTATPTSTGAPPTATFTPTPTATAGACPNLSAGYCRSDNETRTWIPGTTNQNITGDDATKTLTLPFGVSFMGNTYTSVVVSSNGNIHFGTASNAYNNVAIPNSSNPNAMIAAFWDDLNPAAGGAIYTTVSGTAPNRTAVVEWRDVRHYLYGNSGVTFEIQIVEGSNHIWILYQDTIFGDSAYDNGLSATAGIENATGTAGNAYSFNQAVLTSNKVLHFYPQP